MGINKDRASRPLQGPNPKGHTTKWPKGLNNPPFSALFCVWIFVAYWSNRVLERLGGQIWVKLGEFKILSSGAEKGGLFSPLEIGHVRGYPKPAQRQTGLRGVPA